MAQTNVARDSAQASRKFNAALLIDQASKSYFQTKFMSASKKPNTPIQMLTDLKKEAGEVITYELRMSLREQPVYGDANLEGKGEQQRYFTDQVYVDQIGKAVDHGGRMTRQRTKIDLMGNGVDLLGEYFGRLFDELLFIYLSGSRGSNDDYILPIGYTGHAGNAVEAPEASRYILAAGNIASIPANTAAMTSSDTFNGATLDRLVTRARAQGGGTSGVPRIQPCKVDGDNQDYYVIVMDHWQDFTLRRDTAVGGWADIQRALVQHSGTKSPLFDGSTGVWNGAILHKHERAIKFAGSNGVTNYGGGTLNAARALLLGRQAAVVAFAGSGDESNDMQFNFSQKKLDHGRRAESAGYTIVGLKKSRFNVDGTARDFAVMACDSIIPGTAAGGFGV